YSLDNLSMMALILSVGFVVDDAIVMLENIYRHVEMGEEPLAASLVGSREIGFTIVSMTLSLAAVFIPVLFMGGVPGRLVRLFLVVPKGFIPDQDTDQLSAITEAAQGTSYDKLVEYQGRVADVIRRNENVAALVSTVGGSASATLGGPNLGQLVVHLKPRSDR